MLVDKLEIVMVSILNMIMAWDGLGYAHAEWTEMDRPANMYTYLHMYIHLIIFPFRPPRSFWFIMDPFDIKCAAVEIELVDRVCIIHWRLIKIG